MQLVALLIILLTILGVLRRYQTHGVLLIAGFSLLVMSTWLAPERSEALGWAQTGWMGLDPFLLLRDTFASRAGQIGLIIMAAGGFASYMSHIGASEALVRVTLKPLELLQKPYLVLGTSYLVGQILNIFIPSAAGLAMLLLVAMYPTLTRIGLSRVSVAAVIGTTACLDLGPASGASNVAAETAGLEPVIYFVKHQLPVALMVIPTIAILHAWWQRRCDARDRLLSPPVAPVPTNPGKPTAPLAYAVIPILPLLLLLIFSPLGVGHIQLDVVSAMFIGLFVGLLAETIRQRSLRLGLLGIPHFFSGMGTIFAKVVTLIICAEVFATGLKASGIIDGLFDLYSSGETHTSLLVLGMVALIGFTATLSGSGNAALFSFANLVPGLAQMAGIPTVALILPAQLAAGLFRSISPVAGVIIAVANAADTTPLEIVRRTSIPILGGVVAMLLANSLTV
jgi:DcuC family C4-dicarboxylate transporter